MSRRLAASFFAFVFAGLVVLGCQASLKATAGNPENPLPDTEAGAPAPQATTPPKPAPLPSSP